MDDALAAFGLTREAQSDRCEVWEENWEVLTWFLRLERRWIVGAMGGLLRFDDAAILSQLEIYGIKRKKRQQIHRGLMIMEGAAIEVINGQ